MEEDFDSVQAVALLPSASSPLLGVPEGDHGGEIEQEDHHVRSLEEGWGAMPAPTPHASMRLRKLFFATAVREC